MDFNRFKHVTQDLPKPNPLITEGIVYHQTRGDALEIYLQKIITSAVHVCPPEFKFEGCRMLDPFEETKVILGKESAPLQLASNNYRLMEMNFSYDGEPLQKRYIHLYFFEKGGVTVINDKPFVGIGTLASEGLGHTKDGLILKTHKMPIHIKIMDMMHILSSEDNGNYRKELIDSIPFTLLHNKREKNKNVSTVAHYVFCKYGFIRTMQDFYAIEPRIVQEGSKEESDFLKDRKFVVFKSLKCDPYYKFSYNEPDAPDICIVIPRKQVTEEVKNLLASLFYILDKYPDDFSLHERLGDPDWFCFTMGKMFWGDERGYNNFGTYVSDIMEHLKTAESYLDEIILDELGAQGDVIKDIYEFFVLTIKKISVDQILKNRELNSLYGYKVYSAKYLLTDVVRSLNITMFEIVRMSKKDTGLSVAKINSCLARKFPIHKPIMAQLTNHAIHSEMVHLSGSSDNLILLSTGNIVPPEDAGGVRRQSKTSLDSPQLVLHVSAAELSGYATMTKAKPTGRGKINIFAKIDRTGNLIRHEDLREELDETQRFIYSCSR